MPSSSPPRRLFCFGLGYVARALAGALGSRGWAVAGTCRSEEKRRALEADGIDAFIFGGDRPLDDTPAALAGTTHLLASIPPAQGGDAALAHHAGDVAAVETLEWIGYLSTTGVYGNHRGLWVDEETPVQPSGERGARRVDAEIRWLDLWDTYGIPVHVFRLAGIYGPGRSPLDQVRAGAARRIDKPGQVFSRIHVDDIVAVLRASIARPHGGRAYNVCDDKPAPPAEVVAFACDLLGVEAPPLIPFEEAAGLSPVARSFYADNKRVRNDRIKEELGVTLRYPDYESGLRALLDQS